MRLSELIDGGKVILSQDWNDVTINGLSADSRTVRTGYLFAAIPGTQVDGRNYIADAVAQGAAAILAPEGTTRDALPDALEDDIPLITDANPRRTLALMAARFHGAQPDTVVAVTGTNGKTSVAHFVQQLWNACGVKAASLGTIGLTGPGLAPGGNLTTPDPVKLHEMLADLKTQGFDRLAMEASSHGLDQFRLDGVRLTAAAFTNLSRDHLDYHENLEAYRAAKLRLFDTLLAEDGTAVANAETPEADAIADIARQRGLDLVTYGLDSGDIRAPRRSRTETGWTLTVQAFGKTYDTELPLPGEFQIANVLAALGLLHAAGEDIAALIPHLPSLTGVPGRMQRAGVTEGGAAVYVDYAHTPDALATVLRAIRPHVSNELVVLFGCGGDRDRGKRPEMGTIACQLADRVVVTDDNPRSEDPAVIRREILTACDGAIEIGNRREAIETAIAALETGDVLVLAGKGHETGQIVGNRVLPFDDLTVARAALPHAGRDGAR